MSRNIHTAEERNVDDFLTVCVREKEDKVKCEVALTAVDGKMRATLTGRGGVWCLLCQLSRDEAAGKTDRKKLVDCSWCITNTAEQAMQIWNEQSYVEWKRGHKKDM